MSLLVPAMSLAKRELVRFFRQRGRVIGALVTPVMFWLFMGSGLGSRSAAREATSCGMRSRARRR